MPENEPKSIKVNPASELARLLASARIGGEPILVDTGEAVYPLTVQPRQQRPTARVERPLKEGIWADYDPGKVREALRHSAGALTGIDGEALLHDIYEQREQDTPGRPA